jgi:hypothetical protein
MIRTTRQMPFVDVTLYIRIDDGIIYIMKAISLISRRVTIREGVFAEIVLWKVPKPVKGSRHSYKYRLALVVEGICVLRYDNEAGKGDHRHIAGGETPYQFAEVDSLLDDFRSDVRKWLDENRRL